MFVSNLIMATTEEQLRDKFSEVNVYICICIFVYVTFAHEALVL